MATWTPLKLLAKKHKFSTLDVADVIGLAHLGLQTTRATYEGRMFTDIQDLLQRFAMSNGELVANEEGVKLFTLHIKATA